MPNRIIKESICTSDSLDCLSWFEEVLFYRLIVNCDDYGRFDGRTAVIKNRLFPLKENLTLKTVENAINKLANIGLVALYVFEGKPFLYLPTWNEHQNVRAKRSKYPAPEDGVNTSDCKCMQMHADVPVIQSNPNTNKKKNTNVFQKEAAASFTRPKFQKPSIEDVKAYCAQRNKGVDAERFLNYYEANGWKVGKNPMKDWKAAVRTWENNGYGGRGSPKKLQEYGERTYTDEDFERLIHDPLKDISLDAVGDL